MAEVESSPAHTTRVVGYMSLAITLTGIVVVIGTSPPCAVSFFWSSRVPKHYSRRSHEAHAFKASWWGMLLILKLSACPHHKHTKMSFLEACDLRNSFLWLHRFQFGHRNLVSLRMTSDLLF